MSALDHAIAHGDADVVSLLLERGADFDGLDRNGATALYHTVGKKGRMARLLLDARADVNKGKPPLVRAAQHGDVDVVRLFVERDGVDLDALEGNRTALFEAVRQDGSMARLLLDARADVNKGDSTLINAASRERWDLVSLFVEHGGVDLDAVSSRGGMLDGKTALQHAVGKDAVTVRLLLDARADVTKGYSPLVHAAERGDMDVVNLLVECGVDLDELCGSRTALYVAARKNDARIVHLLLGARADVNKGNSPIRAAIADGTGGWVPDGPTEEQMDMVRLLFDNGAKKSDEAVEEVKRALQKLEPSGTQVAGRSFCNRWGDKSPDEKKQVRERLEACLALLQSGGGNNVILNLFVVETTPGMAWSVSVHQIGGDRVASITVDPRTTTVAQLQADISEHISVVPQLQRWVLGDSVLDVETAPETTAVGSLLTPNN